jgi:beta-lactam-binding protein with PASTA domain
MKKLLWNILASVGVLVALIIGTLIGLHSYTRQEQSIEVPDVKGLKIDEAASFFEAVQLYYEVIDSVYNKKSKPGAIVETIPTSGSKVKQGRKIFVTVNAYSVQTGAIPAVADVSYRQVQATLQGLGFEDIRVEYVSGRYKDLVVGLTSQGKSLKPGDRVPLSAPVRILVSNGYQGGYSAESEEPVESIEQ